MNAVLYTQDMQPITVIRLQPFLWDRLWRGEKVRMHVMPPMKMATVHDHLNIKLRTVTIYGEKLCRRQAETLMLFTDDETDALLLKADFLQGQRREQQHRERTAYANGIIEALNALRG
jgi:hypothetical protein